MIPSYQPHPPESDLALYAGGDLSWLRQWRTDRHVRSCSVCQQTAAEFSELRTGMTAAPEKLAGANPNSLEGVNWTRMALEMKANIRLGLEAGQCVGMRLSPRSTISGYRLAWAGGLLTVLIGVGAWMGRADLHSANWQRPMLGTILEASERGIQVRRTGQTLRILSPAARNVIYTVGSQGELGARSLDPETGNVAITHVYGE